MVLDVIDVLECVFIERRNRFTGLAYIGGGIEGVHITNTGRLLEILTPERPCLAYRIDGVKLKYRLAGVKVGEEGYAVIDTILQARAFEKAIEANVIPWLMGCSIASRNPRVGGSLLDYKLTCNGNTVFIEVKSAVLMGPSGEAMYPDCPTTRGQRHVRELIKMANSGLNVMLVMIAGLPNAKCFKPYEEGDPIVYELIKKAYTNGVPVKALSIYIDGKGRIILEDPDLPLCME